MTDRSQVDEALKAISDLLHTGILPESLPDELAGHSAFRQLIADLDTLQEFALSLSKGDIRQPLQLKGRVAGALKLLQANLRHLAWQTQRIAAGDFDQRIDFMGDIADAFNHMAICLEDARAELGVYAARLSQTNEQLQREISQRKDIQYLNAGDLTGLERTARRQLDLAQSGNRLMSEVWARMLLGYVHYERNDLSEADHHYSAGAQLGDRAYARATCECFFGLALTKHALGEQDEAIAVLRSAQSFASDNPSSVSPAELKSLRMRLDLMHDYRSASNLEPEAIQAEPGNPLIYIEAPQLTQAQILVAYGSAERSAAALDILQALQSAAEASQNLRRLIAILALKAMALDAMHQSDDAMKALAKAVEIAQPGGFVRTFVDLGPAMETLLARLCRDRCPSGYVTDLQSACRPPIAAFLTATGEQIPVLSERENEVLQLLADGLLGKHVAARLDISPLTVRTHKHNVYKKLGAHSRRQAVEKARRYGLIPLIQAP